MSLSSSQDRRQQPRAAANARGVVLAQGLEMACVIADMSGGGMRLRLDRNLALPPRITLIDVTTARAYAAEVAWRQGMEAGVRVGAADSVRGLVPSRLLPAREAWLRAGGR